MLIHALSNCEAKHRSPEYTQFTVLYRPCACQLLCVRKELFMQCKSKRAEYSSLERGREEKWAGKLSSSTVHERHHP